MNTIATVSVHINHTAAELIRLRLIVSSMVPPFRQHRMLPGASCAE
jgi:hypothetical protein